MEKTAEIVRGNLAVNMRLKGLLFISAALFLIFLFYITAVLRFDLFITDVRIYWEDSYKWAAPFGPWWVPGYSLLIALLRFISFDGLSPLVNMWIISGLFYLIAVAAIYKLALKLNLKFPAETTIIFAVYPFIGLLESVNPRADATAIALLVLAFLAFENKKWYLLALFAAAAMMVHKATWFFIPPLLLIAFVRHRDSRLWMPLAFVPLLAWMVCGAIYYHDYLWFLHYAVKNLMASRSSLPVLDGLLGPFLSGSPAKFMKGGIVMTTFLLSVACLYYCYRLKYWPGISICFSIMALAITLNSFEIWAVVRFSRVIVIPVAYIVTNLFSHRLPARKYLFVTLLLLGLISNLLFGYYMSLTLKVTP